MSERLSSVAITASRDGTTGEQKVAWKRWLLQRRPRVLRHGACRGGDEDLVVIARAVLGDSVHVVAHPGHPTRDPSDTTHRSQRAIELSDEVESPMPFLKRNRRMVSLTAETYGCPPCPVNPGRGGTWSTIEHSREEEHPTWVVMPSGEEVGP